MTIQTPLRTRLAFGIGGAALVLITLWLTWYAIVVQHSDPTTVGIVGATFVLIFGAMTVFGAMPGSLRADADTVGLYRFIGPTKTAPRARIKTIALAPA